MIVDRCHSLCVELINDDNYDSLKAMGLSTYSNSKSTVTYYLSVFEILWKQTDIYQKVEDLYKELKYKNETQLQLINITAHELRSPIQPILGLSEVMLYNRNIDTIQKETMLKIIIKNAKKIKLLTANILEFASIEEQLSSSLEFQEVDLLLLISTVIEEIKFLNEGKKLNIIVENNQITNTNLVADKNRLSQVFLNLIGNSVKHAERGNITISITKKNKKQILIHVIDEGMGIPLHIQQKLFSKFVTGSKTGNGLGLFICKNIIERHGGQIWAKNNTNGKGATFSFTLPIINENF